jgi:hypothetical protein
VAENPSPVSGDEENDGADALRAALNRCRQPLRDLMPAPQDNEGFARSRRPAVPVAVPPERLPVPHSVALVMSLVLGAHNLGRREKLMWEYPFTYRGRHCSIALEKFGLRLYLGRDDSSLDDDSTIADKTVEDELISKISKATRCVENKVLSNIADEQDKAGRITIGNQVGQLRQMYEYFRDRASDAYAGRGPLARKYEEQIQDAQRSPQASQRIRAGLMSVMLPLEQRREGLYTTVAMTYAYCSLLEHMFVLVLPAIDFDPTTESVTEFILKRKLFDKYERVFDIVGDPAARKFHVRLHDVIEKWRNPYAHGGFDRRRGIISFHVDGVGAIPRLMSDVRTHPTFHLAPERESSFDQVCALFDELDAWLRSGPVKHGVQWAESGLDVPFNPEFLTEFRAASGADDATFERFLRRMDYMVDQAANMDW